MGLRAGWFLVLVMLGVAAEEKQESVAFFSNAIGTGNLSIWVAKTDNGFEMTTTRANPMDSSPQPDLRDFAILVKNEKGEEKALGHKENWGFSEAGSRGLTGYIPFVFEASELKGWTFVGVRYKKENKYIGLSESLREKSRCECEKK